VTCGARAHSAAIVIQVNVVFLRQFQNGFVLEITRHGFGCYARIFKQKLYSSHVMMVGWG
jgi:hypothetical protein